MKSGYFSVPFKFKYRIITLKYILLHDLLLFGDNSWN